MTPKLRIATIAGMLVLCAIGGYAHAESSAEVAVKAAVVHKIAKFVSWPDDTFKSARSPMRFCIAEHPKMYEAMQQLTDRPVHGRPLHVNQPEEPAAVRDSCDVLYVHGDGQYPETEWLRGAADHPILTFGETSNALSVVTIMIRRNKVRFAINTDASKRVGLDVSAQLLQLSATLSGNGASE